MHVNMKHLLSGILVAIHKQAIAPFGHALFFGDYFGGREHVADELFVFRQHVIHRGDLLIGHDQNVHRRLGVDIPKGGHLVITKDDIGGDFTLDDLAENSRHGRLLSGKDSLRMPFLRVFKMIWETYCSL
jgi:hypothetical protein